MAEITCPRCALAFEPTARLRAEIEADVEARLAGERAAHDAELRRRTRELEQRERLAALSVEEQVQAQLASARPALRAEAEQRAEAIHKARADAELAAMREQLGIATAAAATASRKEAELLRRARELEQRERDAELAFERKLADELPKLAARAEAQAKAQGEVEQQRLELVLREQRLKAEQLEKTIDELRQQARQGSQQLQGEAQEASLRELLMAAFATDEIADVATGVRGADLLQRVRDEVGHEVGTIIWESKRTKAWSDTWLGKLRDDQRATGAAAAVIVSQALPAGVTHVAQLGGTWVCGWQFASALAVALRAGLLEVALARRAGESRGDKAEMLLDYLTSTEFRNRVGGVVEAIAEMQADLESERRAMERLWKQREKQLVRAHRNLAAFYGDLRGIAGRKVAELGALELGGGLTGRADDAGDADADGERTMQARDRSATPTWRPEPRGAVAGGVVGGAVGASVGGAVGVSVDAADLDVPNYVEDDDSAAVSVDATTPAELVGLLYALLPEDGAACASSALLDQFVAAADATLGVPVSDADFARCRDVLLARGMIRRGKGRGAPLARRSASLPGPLFSR